MVETYLNSLETVLQFDIKALPFNYYTPSISGGDCCASVPQHRGDSFSVRSVCMLTGTSTLLGYHAWH